MNIQIKAIFKLENNRYNTSKDSNFWPLNWFFLDEISCSICAILRIQEWLLSSLETEVTLNISSLEKEAKLILLSIDMLNLFMEIDKHNFGQLLEQWKKVCEEKPKEVLVKQKADGTIFIEGNNDIIPDAFITFDNGRYSNGGSNDKALENIVFIFDDLFNENYCSLNWFLTEWLDDPKQTRLQVLNVLIEKTENDKIIFFYGRENIENKVSFVITTSELKKLYANVQQIKMLHPKVIRFYQDNDKLCVEGHEDEI